MESKAMTSTPVDIKEFPNSYVFIIDMPGLKNNGIKVQLEDGKVMTISEEQTREKKDNAKFICMELMVGKFIHKFTFPDNYNIEATSASCQDGVLSVTVPKLPPPQPNKPKTFEVKVN